MMISAIIAVALALTPGQGAESHAQGFEVRNGIAYLEQPVDIDGAIYAATWPSLSRFVTELKRGDPNGARSALKNLVAQGKADDGALNLLAQIERHDGDLDTALKRIEEAIKTAPRQHLHYFQEALICFQLREKASIGLDRWKWHGRTQEAYEKALELEPRGVYYRYYVAYSYMSTPEAVGGNRQQALKLTQDGIDLGFDAFYVIRADVYRSLQQPGEAFSDYDRSVKLKVFKTNAFLGAVHYAIEKKDMVRAKSYCDYMLACVPEDPRTDEAYGDYFAAIGNNDKAAASYRLALKKTPSLTAIKEKLDRIKKN